MPIVAPDPAVPLAVRPETDERQPRYGRHALVAVAVGILLAIAWSFEFVDGVIGDNVANTLLGHDAKQTAIGGTVAGLAFAFVSGLAGTFTACNIAVFGLAPQVARQSSTQGRIRGQLSALGWLTTGLMVVAVGYGALGVWFSDSLPQLSTDTVGDVPVRLIQASVVFGVVGLAFVYLGLAALGLAPDPFARRPRTRLLVMGALIGAFLIGRPFPLFRKLFEYAVAENNAAYGAAVFALQAIGNILIMVVVVVLLSALSRGRLLRVLADDRRYAWVAGTALVALGVFLVVYWDVRLPAMFGYGWFPTAPWN
ncbi:hypothetical protein QQG74_13295 [Micromonospora sp. FIMYZ51]|uniref:hypothetical protein n=1 Tax=Micromonospora sp. FIMYZ51 TaxID=3051832 RepID=UPI00311E6D07